MEAPQHANFTIYEREKELGDLRVASGVSEHPFVITDVNLMKGFEVERKKLSGND